MEFVVIDVEATDDYKLLLKFKNGEKKKFDMKPLLTKGIFKDLVDLKVFKSARINLGTVEWSNGADIDPERLFKDSTSLQQHSSSRK